MLKNTIKGLALSGAVLATTSFAVQADVLSKVKEKKEIVVGVKTDYPPFGFLNASGEISGIEPILAKEIADDLGVKLKLIPVLSSNRIQFLQQGKIDLMIATMSVTEKRRKILNVIDPYYYASGTNILFKGGLNITKWEQLKGKTLCGNSGAFYNKRTQEEYNAKVIAFKGSVESKQALKQGRCIGWVFDDSSIVATLKKPEWKGYEMTLPTIDATPWGMAVVKGEEGLSKFVAEKIKSWHKSGRLLELEKQFGIKNTPFVIEQNKKYQ